MPSTFYMGVQVIVEDECEQDFVSTPLLNTETIIVQGLIIKEFILHQ